MNNVRERFAINDLFVYFSIESHTYLMETDTTITDASSPSSPSVLQSCVTNADVTVSRISQVTRPVSVSINTAHVMSFQRLTELSSVEGRHFSNLASNRFQCLRACVGHSG